MILKSRIIIKYFADRVRIALNREAGEKPALSRSCNAEPLPNMSLGNREGREDDDAEPEELPDRNAVSSLRETGRRDFFVYYICLFAGEQEGFFIL